MAHLYLIAAIASELVGTLATRQSAGFTRLWPSVIAVIGVVGAYVLLAQSLKLGMSVGAAYATWAAVGVVLVAAIGAVFLGDRLSGVQALGIALIVGGVLAVELGRPHEPTG